MLPEDVYGDLLAAVSNVGADLSGDCEQFLLGLRTEFKGSDEDFVLHVQQNVGHWFRVVKSYPEWIQNADWQFHKGEPMMFVGEIPIPKSAGLYHDDACVFVFLSEDGITKCVIQVA